MADLLRKYKSLYSSTTNSFGTGEAVTITPSSVVGLPTDTEITLTFDRVAADGTTETPTLMERIKGTISGGNFVVASGGRGYDGSTEQAHTSPVVEQVWNAKDWNDSIAAFITEHNQAGTHTNITACNVTASGVGTFTSNIKVADTKSIIDGNSNELVKWSQTASAVNEFTVANAVAGSGPTLSATGNDTNIDININGKGTGGVKGRHAKRVGSTTSSATPTINTDNVDIYRLTAQAADITSFTTNLSGTPVEGDMLLIEITGTAARAITWGASFEASTVALPTTTVTTAMLQVLFKWNSATSKWRCLASV